MNTEKFPWIKSAKLAWMREGETFAVTLDRTIYSPDVILKTAYLFLEQCYIFIEPSDINNTQLKVCFSPMNESDDLEILIAEFGNQLVLQEVRQRVSLETQSIREIIVAQALIEGDVLDRTLSEADYNVDPLNIAR
jgi:His-Xaa-Ser system protein HxsD